MLNMNDDNNKQVQEARALASQINRYRLAPLDPSIKLGPSARRGFVATKRCLNLYTVPVLAAVLRCATPEARIPRRKAELVAALQSYISS